jgi:hypothetical protein
MLYSLNTVKQGCSYSEGLHSSFACLSSLPILRILVEGGICLFITAAQNITLLVVS